VVALEPTVLGIPTLMPQSARSLPFSHRQLRFNTISPKRPSQLCQLKVPYSVDNPPAVFLHRNEHDLDMSDYFLRLPAELLYGILAHLHARILALAKSISRCFKENTIANEAHYVRTVLRREKARERQNIAALTCERGSDLFESLLRFDDCCGVYRHVAARGYDKDGILSDFLDTFGTQYHQADIAAMSMQNPHRPAWLRCMSPLLARSVAMCLLRLQLALDIGRWTDGSDVSGELAAECTGSLILEDCLSLTVREVAEMVHRVCEELPFGRSAPSLPAEPGAGEIIVCRQWVETDH